MRSASTAPKRLPTSSPSWPVSRRTSTPVTAAGCTRPSAWSGTPGAAAAPPRTHDQVPDRGALRGGDPVLGDTRASGRRRPLRVVRIEEHRALRVVEVVLVLDGGGRPDPVGVVEHQAEVAQPADAGLRADGRLADLDAREAERALLGLAGAMVEVHLLVRAAGDAHPPAPAAVLVDQHDAVLGPLVDRAGRAGRRAGGVEAVLADAGQEEQERLLVLLAYRAGELAGSGRRRRSRCRRPGSRPSSPTR